MTKYNPMTDGLEQVIRPEIKKTESPGLDLFSVLWAAAIIGFTAYVCYEVYLGPRSDEIQKRHAERMRTDSDYAEDYMGSRISRGRW